MTTDVSLFIDGQKIVVPIGTTIMEAAQQLGIKIAHFCWEPRLSVAGVCRMCVVKISGMPGLQIACNTSVTEGMDVCTSNLEISNAQKWILEYHLINHPLDCPICDQAGECKLQEYYMNIGCYSSQLTTKKVLKQKMLDVGPQLVLDTERCILCSICVRFENEVTKTRGLGIVNRGDKSEICLTLNRQLTHNYTYNLADICPVGAFTSKSFRFRCRVWFLKDTDTICPGCSTGCKIKIYYNPKEKVYYRIKPAAEQNWLCDYGRSMYEHINACNRSTNPYFNGNLLSYNIAIENFKKFLTEIKETDKLESTVLIMTPQYTLEEYHSIFDNLMKYYGKLPTLRIWRPQMEDVSYFDNILFRGDRHPNSNGLLDILQMHQLAYEALTSDFESLSKYKYALIFGPEIEKSYHNLPTLLQDICANIQDKIVYFGIKNPYCQKEYFQYFPIKTFAEKNGTYINYEKKEYSLNVACEVFPNILEFEALWRLIWQ